MSVSNKHPLKASHPIEVTDDGMPILASDLHSSKAQSPIDVTNDGIFISISDEHPPNELFPIDVTGIEINAFVNDEQELNKLSGIWFISPVILIDLTPLKTYLPIEVIEERSEISVKEEHP